MMQRLILCATALAFGILAPALGSRATAQPTTRGATPTPIPSPPASTLPYPAYGTPAPGVSQTRAAPGVPVNITLTQAIDIAVAISPSMATARANLALAQANVGLARAPALPSLSGTATTNRSNSQASINGNLGNGTNGAQGNVGNLGNGGSSTSSRSGAFTSNSLTANLRQLIFDGGRVANQIRAASENEVASADNLKRQLQTTAFNVAAAYYNAIQAQRATTLAAAIVRQNQVQESLVAAQIRAGTAARSDLATAQFPTAQARVSLVKAQGTELAALATFANTLGLNADTAVRPIDTTPSNPTASLLQTPLLTYDTALTRAISLRPDYDAADRVVRGARDSLRAARLGLFPSLTGNGSYGVNSTDATGGTFRNSNSIGAALSIPIFDQGLTAAQSAQAQANLDIANASFQTTVLGIQLNVRQVLVNLVSAQAALDQTQAELNQARTVLQATQAQYRAGVTSLPLLLNAQVGLTTAQTDNLNAIYALRQAEQSYLFALGENDLANSGS